MTAVDDVLLRAPAAVFVPVDTFLAKTVPGPALGLDRLPRSPLRFGVLTATFGGTQTRMPPGWWLITHRTASGAYATYGDMQGPDGVRRRLVGPPTPVTLSAESRLYRPQPVPVLVQLVNLDPDPAVNRVDVVPEVVELAPGVLYPFPARPSGFAIVRGRAGRAPIGPGTDGVTVTASAPTSGNTPAFGPEQYVTEHGGQFVFTVPDAGLGTRRVTLSATGAQAVNVDVAPSGSVIAQTIVIP